MHSYFTNTKSKKEIIDIYYKKLTALHIDYEFLTVETSFGDTNIVITGNKNKPPLVVVHGLNSCAPNAIDTVIDLREDYKVIAIDVLGQPNLSSEVRLNPKTGDYGKWMYEIFSRLNLYNITLVGISFGGFICVKALIYDQKRIAKTFLVTPSGITNSFYLNRFIKLYLPIKLYQWTKKYVFLFKYLNRLNTQLDYYTFSYTSKLFLNYKHQSTTYPILTKNEITAITTPIYIVVAKKDILFPCEKLQKRAKEFFSSLVDIKVIEGAKHILDKKSNRTVTDFIKTESLK